MSRALLHLWLHVVAFVGMVAPGLAAEPVATLAIAHDGLMLLREDKPLERFATLAELVRAYPGLEGRFTVEVAAAVKGAGKAGQVRISAGTILVGDFLRYLSDATGLPVICDSTDKSLVERTIHIAAPIDNASEALVRRLLEANRLRVTESATGREGRVLVVESMEATPLAVEPRPVPIVRVRSLAEATLEHDAPGAGSPARRQARSPEGGPAELAGVALENVPEMLQSQLALVPGEGVFVARVDPVRVKTSRALAVLAPFDVVTHVGNVKVNAPVKLVEAINAVPPAEVFHLRVIRKGMTTILKAEK